MRLAFQKMSYFGIIQIVNSQRAGSCLEAAAPFVYMHAFIHEGAWIICLQFKMRLIHIMRRSVFLLLLSFQKIPISEKRDAWHYQNLLLQIMIIILCVPDKKRHAGIILKMNYCSSSGSARNQSEYLCDAVIKMFIEKGHCSIHDYFSKWDSTSGA